MKQRSLLGILSIILVTFFSCQKEISFEVPVMAVGSLQADLGGECLPKAAAGTFVAEKALGDTNYINIQVEVAEIGSYTIYTDTVNGISFRATGTFNTTGLTTVTLKGKGTPLAEGTHTFIITYAGSNADTTFSTSCEFPLMINPVGSSGPGSGSPGGDPGVPMTGFGWELTEGTTKLSGTTDGAITLPLSGLVSCGIGGESTDGNTSFALSLTKNGSTMSAGTFKTNATSNFATLIVMDNNTGDLLYSGIYGSGALTVNLTTYNETTHVAEGTLSGTVKNKTNATVSISGKFRAEIL